MYLDNKDHEWLLAFVEITMNESAANPELEALWLYR